MAIAAGVRLDPAVRNAERVALFSFGPRRRLMATLDHEGADLQVHVKGAPETLLPLRVTDAAQADALAGAVEEMTSHGLRVLAVARRSCIPTRSPPTGTPRRAPG